MFINSSKLLNSSILLRKYEIHYNFVWPLGLYGVYGWSWNNFLSLICRHADTVYIHIYIAETVNVRTWDNFWQAFSTTTHQPSTIWFQGMLRLCSSNSSHKTERKNIFTATDGRTGVTNCPVENSKIDNILCYYCYQILSFLKQQIERIQEAFMKQLLRHFISVQRWLDQPASTLGGNS